MEIKRKVNVLNNIATQNGSYFSHIYKKNKDRSKKQQEKGSEVEQVRHLPCICMNDPVWFLIPPNSPFESSKSERSLSKVSPEHMCVEAQKQTTKEQPKEDYVQEKSVKKCQNHQSKENL